MKWDYGYNSSELIIFQEQHLSKVFNSHGTLVSCFLRQIGKDVFVELDVGSEDNSNEAQIRAVLYSVVSNGSIASYVTSVRGFEFRRLGERKDPEYHIKALIIYLTFSILTRGCMTTKVFFFK